MKNQLGRGTTGKKPLMRTGVKFPSQTEKGPIGDRPWPLVPRAKLLNVEGKITGKKERVYRLTLFRDGVKGLGGGPDFFCPFLWFCQRC